MRKHRLLLINILGLFLAVLAAPGSNLSVNTATAESKKETPPEKRNRLDKEKSPYLLQHRNNPVHWYPWGEEAFQAAKKENKPIFLSIGYSTCYWCHMMEKDSFEMQEVADVLNKHFICIKVDREERPDVDKVYMDAVMAMTGRGGWPMSVFLTPELKPFYGGTFFWRAQFIELLNRLNAAWREDPTRVEKAAAELTTFLVRQEEQGGVSEELGVNTFRLAYQQFRKTFDATYGGFGSAPKFPRGESIQLLLRIHQRTGDKVALEMAEKTLDAMARGGMYDHLGGGFHRYSTDEKWLVPHFEKMLYDNALLPPAYLEAYQITGKTIYREVARESLDYILSDMTTKDGSFHSAEDAGEVKKEGEYYVWTETELKQALSKEEFAKVRDVYGVTAGGNFEHATNIFNLQQSFGWDVKDDATLQSAHKKLLAIRDKRVRPHRDDKILTAWNGLMISAMAHGYQVLNDERYLNAAQQAARFIKKNLFADDTLKRRYREGEAKHEGYLSDYAYLIQGLLDLYESDYDIAWLSWARELQATQDKLFWDEKDFGYFFSLGNDKSLIVRQKDFSDGSLPSGNAVSSLNLLRLFSLTFERAYQTQAEQVLNVLSSQINRYPAGHGAAMAALDFHNDRAKEIVVVGELDSEPAKKMQSYVRDTFLPNAVSAFGKPAEVDDEKALTAFRGKKVMNNKTTFYICEEGSCKAPTNDFEQAKKLITDNKRYSLSAS